MENWPLFQDMCTPSWKNIANAWSMEPYGKTKKCTEQLFAYWKRMMSIFMRERDELPLALYGLALSEETLQNYIVEMPSGY
jgi:hypothetical protein